MTSSSSSLKRQAAETTVFVRWMPSSANIRRHHLEELFSQIGPIRKSSVIVPRRNNNNRQDDKSTTDDRQEQNEESGAPTIASSYGFIKYTTVDDAKTAASKLDHSSLQISPTEILKLRVEQASAAQASGNAAKKKQKNTASDPKHIASPESREKEHKDSTNTMNNKAKNRVILRNLSFYAKESHVRNVLESKFGKVTEVHLPLVPTEQGDEKQKKKPTTTHRGFCFVTFEQFQDAQSCLQSSSGSLVIHKRPVTVAPAVQKALYESSSNNKKNAIDKQKEPNNKRLKMADHKQHVKDKDQRDSSNDDNNLDKDDGDDDDDDESMEESDASNNDEESLDSDNDDEVNEQENDVSNVQRDETAVAERRCLFVRNLPFDTTRHDLFEVFRRFGYITGIFLVKDKETIMPKGTAFVSFRNADAAAQAVQQTSSTVSSSTDDDKFLSQREATENQNNTSFASGDENALKINGRRIFVNLALDKDTASTLIMEKSFDRNSSGKDRRNLYLKGEGRVDNDTTSRKEGASTAWDDLPEQDKAKRQRAWSDKNTKLRSPIFFINPTRLSIRNLDKQVAEFQLKELVVEATTRGLERNLVSNEDMITHWRASGEMTMREIMSRVEPKDGMDTNPIIPPFDQKNVRKHIPSVFIDRDFSGNKGTGGNKSAHPSRGFAFVEFQHHAHALACLRELNNNTYYSTDYAAGGRHALTLKQKQKKSKKLKQKSMTSSSNESTNDYVGSDGHIKVPRLIVEFTVENKAKARIQAEHREHQQANKMKQQIQNREKQKSSSTSAAAKKKEKKQSRGARQRERKRKGMSELSEHDEDKEKEVNQGQKDANAAKDVDSKQQVVAAKPAKKRPPKKQKKMDGEDSHFENLVASYEKGILEASSTTEGVALPKKKKRWFED